jgi:hypothetical protein
MRDPDQAYLDLVVRDGVDDAVLPPTGGPVAVRFGPEWRAGQVRIRGEWPVGTSTTATATAWGRAEFDGSFRRRGEDDRVDRREGSPGPLETAKAPRWTTAEPSKSVEARQATYVHG